MPTHHDCWTEAEDVTVDPCGWLPANAEADVEKSAFKRLHHVLGPHLTDPGNHPGMLPHQAR